MDEAGQAQQIDARTYEWAEDAGHNGSRPGVDRENGSAKVLLADDDPVILESLEGLVRQWGYEPVSFRGGRQALECLSAPEGPGLAVLDWMLPDIYGTEICRRLRASPNSRGVYIILLTGRDESADIVEGLGAGADDYLRKPYNPLELRARLDAGSRKMVERALRDSELRFQSAFEHAGVAMALVGPTGKWLQVNSALCNFLGYSSRELLATDFQALTHADDLSPSLTSLQQFHDGTLKIHQTEKRYRHKQGKTVWGLLTVSPVFNAEGKPAYFVAQIQDITEQKRALQALHQREAQLQLVLDSTEEAILGMDLKGNCTFSNRACLKLLGYQTSDLLGKNLHQLLHHTAVDGSPVRAEQCLIQRALSRGECIHADQEIAWKADGTSFYSEYWSHPIWEDGKPVGCVVALVDITNRKLTEDALRAAHAESELFINSVPSILIGTDATGHITRWNVAAANTFALPAAEVRHKPLHECGIRWALPGMETEITAWLRAEEGNRRVDLPFEKDGARRFLGATVNRVTFADDKSAGLLITGTDITDRRHLEVQLRQAQKLEAIGQLAAGIAHEINTPTQYVGDNTTFIKDSWPAISDLARAAQRLDRESRDGTISPESSELLRRCIEGADLEYLLDEIPKAIQQSLEGVQRVAKIVHAMKEFSHPGSEEKSEIDINRAIETTITVARNEWKYVCEVETHFETGLPFIPCHAGEFNQVILNLLINAAHAIRQVVGDGSGKKGKIEITTRQEQGWAEIAIHDTGAGIPEEIQSRIFEPFFTTKPVGQGTGQGLALAHTIVVRKHGGRIWFESVVGKGTTFFIRLPISPLTAET